MLERTMWVCALALRGCTVHPATSAQGDRRAKLALALVVARLIDPASKLATARALLDQTTALHRLGRTLGAVFGLTNHHTPPPPDQDDRGGQ